MIVFNILIICLSLLILKYIWSRRKLYCAARKFRGEIAFPLIGAAWVFWNSTGKNVKVNLHVMLLSITTNVDLDIVLIISQIVRKCGSPSGFWLGTRFVIYFTEPEHAEIIINSPNSMDKGGVYTHVQDMIGGPGLFSSGGNCVFLM